MPFEFDSTKLYCIVNNHWPEMLASFDSFASVTFILWIRMNQWHINEKIYLKVIKHADRLYNHWSKFRQNRPLLTIKYSAYATSCYNNQSTNIFYNREPEKYFQLIRALYAMCITMLLCWWNMRNKGSIFVLQKLN